MTIRLHSLIFVFLGLLTLTQPAAAQSGANEPSRLTQSARPSSGFKPGLSCAPAPCVLPPTEASIGADDAAIAADPLDPQYLIQGNDNQDCPYPTASGFNISLDGGSNWSDLVCMIPVFRNGTEYNPVGSPILGYDHDGVAYIGGFYMNDSGESAFGFEGVEKSADGITWRGPAAAVIRQHYYPISCWMAVDASASSPYVNSVYVSCIIDGPLGYNTQNQVVVSHSNDGGLSWQQANVTTVQKSPDIDRNTSLAIGEDGSVYVAWLYCNSGPYECENDKGYMLFSKSSDGGNTWTSPVRITTVLLNHGGLPNTQIGVTNTPAIGVDNSGGPHTGNLYVVMYNWTGSFLQVQVVRSSDGGTTWSKPVPVAPGITHDQFMPWLSVSPTGLVGVSWLDRRNDPANINYQAFAAISGDGGLSFQPNIQLTNGFSNPTQNTFRTIGVYTGDTWDGSNYFLATWMDNSNGTAMEDYVGGIRLH